MPRRRSGGDHLVTIFILVFIILLVLAAYIGWQPTSGTFSFSTDSEILLAAVSGIIIDVAAIFAAYEYGRRRDGYRR